MRIPVAVLRVVSASHEETMPLSARRVTVRCVRASYYALAMTKWEYVTAPLLVHATKQILDNWGDQGWELVQVVPGPNPENLVAYFKREKQEKQG